MSGATPLPRVGEVFFDARGEDRALRLSWHPEPGVMVFSFWNRGVCTSTFRLPAAEVPALLETLAQGVPAPEPRGRRHAGPSPVPSTAADDRPAPPPVEAPEGHPAPTGPFAPPAGWPPQPPFPATGEYQAPPQR
ncbi:hypothetical protein [Actinomadura sp. HBU206391]|uniref:hypothetical protein n=1 Tax=Actinomadura sp. HBU206391 TaxID=2731692 RepID=UPI00165036ED|nr:hypothetical protein [Actinomadura sp. HBU206391]MBC6462703.1 hypothetical protein [Actinomadura sp. HBU206391]